MLREDAQDAHEIMAPYRLEVMMSPYPVAACLVAFSTASVLAVPLDETAYRDRPVTRMAFGSCANHEYPQPIWEAIGRWHPDVFIFLGDNVYGDTEDMEVLAAKYAALGAKPGFQAMQKHTAVIATWDDHDYGANDAGLEYPKKAESKEVFLDFFQEPVDSERRTHSGIYTSYLLGPPSERVQIILLDVRTFRTPLQQREITETMDEGFIGPYAPRDDETSTMLGEAQWTWLEAQLRKPARIRVFGMSTQFGPEFNGWEAWANMPRERQKMIDLIRRTRARGVIFISGDTHWAELSRVEEPELYPLYDLTSSGLTEVWRGIAPNQHRIMQPFLGANFGTIQIDWDQYERGPRVLLGIRDVTGRKIIEKVLWLDELDFKLEPDVEIPLKGSWNSSRGELVMAVDGDRVTGTFENGAGTFSGRLKGRIIIGTWSMDDRTGPFRFTISRTGPWLHGRYGIDGEGGPDPMPWSWTAGLQPK